MSQARAISLASKLIDEKEVGPKAMSLVRLSRIGLAVPPGFCIAGTVFREHLEQNNLIARIKSALDELEKTKSDAKGAILSDLRKAIVEAPLAEAVRHEIENRYRTLGAGRVAVRSSATAEDLPGHSFAGQYDTYLGVANLEDCIDAVKKCWASLCTLRAYEYRDKNGFDHIKINMAVIVQSLIAADASGVIFTVDPVTGRRGNMVIEACFGLGEALVSGKVTPDRFVIDKKKLNLLSRKISEKKIECVLGREGTVQEQAIPKERSFACCLDKKQIRRLAKLARKVEIEFGCPQDIEWAVCRKKIYLLQSRPITAIPPEKSWEDLQVWTNANTGEVMPDVLTPLTRSMVPRLFDRAIDQAFTLLCIKLDTNPLYGFVGGRLYFNINTCIGALRCFPILRNLDFHAIFGGDQRKLADVGQLDIPEEDTPDLEFSLMKMLLMVPGFVFRILTYKPKKGEAMILEIKNRGVRLQDLDIAGMSTETLARTFVAEIIDTEEFIADKRTQPGILYGVIGAASLQLLRKVCVRWFGNDGNTVANRLLAGLGNMDDAQAGLDLWRLAQEAHEIGDVEKAILYGNDWKTTRKEISEVPKGSQFLESWKEFMSRHGHHCRGEMEVFNARWAETPEYILSIVRNYIHGIEQANPLENYRQYARRREELTELCRKRLKNPLKRTVFNHFLTHAQRFMPIRENSKSDFARVITVWRNMLLELGKRLQCRGILAGVEDIFFLRLEEIEPVTRGKAKCDIRQVVAQRRAEYEKNKSVTPPKVVIGQFDPDNFTPEAVDTSAEVLNGLAVSSGIVTGKARVILKADTDEQVLPGEILIAPFTDPGWTPYLVPAAAVVMDMGGMLSHGSIVAREYGMPAVVNVGPATRIIKTGQTIQVDGNHGQVKLLQSRPRENLASSEAETPQDSYIWSSFALEEVMPDVVTPFMWSMLQCLGHRLFDPSLRSLCINRQDIPVFDLIAGRLYFNASFWTAVIMCLPGSRSYDFRKNAGNETGLLELLEKLENTTQEDLPKIEFHRIRFFLKLPLLLIRTIANTPKKGQSILANAKSMNEKWQSLDISSLSAEQIAEYCNAAIDDFDRLLIVHAPYLFSVMTAFPALEIVCAKWLSDDGSRAKKLLAGLGNMDDAQSAMDLWRLALEAHESPDIETAILAGDCWKNIAQRVSTLQKGDAFLKSWDEFMERHGHHCRAELELYNPRWYETPDYILGLIRSYITCIGKTDPLENSKKLAYGREQLATSCRRKLRNRIKRLIFNKLLIRSQKSALFRENIKSEVIKLIAVMRKMLLELGQRFVNEGLLADPNDVFFLELEDINQITKGRHKFDFSQVAATRRREYERWQSITPPKVVVGSFDPNSLVPEVVDTDTEVLNGWAVSSGVAIGKARVILRADTDEQVLAGEILVAPFTDPGWTPYFLPAAAIVMNQGSLLSHGSIVAREYGIPAVVNVGPATEIIKTGQTIQVDGNRGVVTILR
ncbi:MAG: PEP/pyruvate-binding domain-containing protein [Phycisphaerales bacterium]|jgi:pyruvate,water dikinase